MQVSSSSLLLLLPLRPLRGAVVPIPIPARLAHLEEGIARNYSLATLD